MLAHFQLWRYWADIHHCLKLLRLDFVHPDLDLSWARVWSVSDQYLFIARLILRGQRNRCDSRYRSPEELLHYLWSFTLENRFLYGCLDFTAEEAINLGYPLPFPPWCNLLRWCHRLLSEVPALEAKRFHTFQNPLCRRSPTTRWECWSARYSADSHQATLDVPRGSGQPEWSLQEPGRSGGAQIDPTWERGSRPWYFRHEGPEQSAAQSDWGGERMKVWS